MKSFNEHITESVQDVMKMKEYSWLDAADKKKFEAEFLKPDGFGYNDEKYAKRWVLKRAVEPKQAARSQKIKDFFDSLPSATKYPGGMKGTQDYFRDVKKRFDREYPGVLPDTLLYKLFVKDTEVVTYKGKRYKVKYGWDVRDMLEDILP